MLDLAYIREHAAEVRAGLSKLYADAPLDAILLGDAERRQLLGETETLRARRNEVSKQISRMREDAGRQALIEEMRQVGDRVKAIEERLKQVEEELRQNLLEMPNMPDPAVPVGKDDSENVIVRQEGTPRAFDFTPVPHWDLGPALDIIDFDRGVKIAGTRFYVLKGAGARLQRAIIAWMLDLHTQKHGYTEVLTPYMVSRDCLVGTGQLPKFSENLYFDAEDDLWFIPTAEVPVTNMYREEIIGPGKLPIRMVAFSSCFRREKMSAGRDVRGIKRGHQFDKVEMVKIVEPETSREELFSLIADAEDVCRGLGLPHRVVQMCTGDLSFTAAEKYDIEVWAPGCGEWLEVSSCSNFGEFQARRANIRYRPDAGAKPRFAHTLNGSGLALPRTLIAVIENYQQADGSIEVPAVLRPYMGGVEAIR
jgi:seryl-tRNA synthetase